MASYSSARATLGGSDVRKTTRQTRKKAPTPVTVNAVTGGAGVRRVTRQTSRATSSTPTSTSSASAPTRTRPSGAARRARAAARQERQQERVVSRLIRQKPEKVARTLTKRTSDLAKKTDTPTRPKVELSARNRVTPKTIEVKPRAAKKLLTSPPKQAKVKLARKLIKTSGAAPPPALARAAGTRTRRAPEARTASRRAQSEQRRVRRLRSKLTKAAKKSEGGLARKLDRGFGPNEKITPRQTAIVAESEGLPGVTYAQAIAPGESGHRPGVPNPDDATPSLFQITPSVQSAATQAKFDRIAAKRPGGYSNPIVAAKQAKVLAKGSSDAGVSNYVAFNPSAPQGHLPGGQATARRKLYGNPKPIPKPLKQKAKKVLGPQKTRKVIQRAKNPEPTSTAPKKQKGVYEGSRAIVKELIGPKVAKTQDWQDKEDRGDPGGTMHDIGTMDAFAADLPVDEKTVDTIARKLGLDPKEVNYGTTGLESGIIYKGYDIEFLPYDHGGGPHIHIGAKWVGGGATSAPVTPTSGGGGYSTSAISTGGTTTTPLADLPPAQRKKAKRRAKRMEGRDKSRLIRALIANTPAPIPTVEVTRTTPAEQPVTLGIT